MTSPTGLTSILNINDLGQVTQVVDPRGKVRGLSYDLRGLVSTFTDADGKISRVERDVTGRVLRDIRPDGKASSYAYNAAGQVETITDEKGRMTRYVYDPFGRLERTLDPAGQATAFEYDLMSNLIKLTDAKGRETRYEYDTVQRVTKMIDPRGGEETYEYWPTGRLKRRTDRRNIVTDYAYDAIGRLLTRTHSDATPSLNVVYDDDARTVTAADGVDTITWAFDLRGRLISESSTKNASTVAYSYDNGDRRLSTSLDASVFATYTSTQGLLSAIHRGAKTWGFTYDDVGQRTSMSLPNGLVTSYSFDPNLRWLNEVKTMNGASIVMQAQYTHDDVGNRLTKGLLEGVENYSYDTLDRLVGAARSDTEQRFGYDAVGNRTMADTDGIARDAVFAAGNRLESKGLTGSLLVSGASDEPSTVMVNGQPATALSGNRFEKRIPFSGAGAQSVSVVATDGTGNARTNTYEVNVTDGSATYSYDLSGNLTQKVEGPDTWTYSWNALEQLISASKNSVAQASFKYDPVGRRVEKATPAKVTTYTYDGADILRESVTVGGNTTTSYYVHGPGIDEPLGKETGGVMTYFHADGLGSIVKETDQTGAVTNTLRYDAWGNIEAGVRDGFAFTGREWDPEIGLYYYRARYYDPGAGRFISEDPIGFGGGDANFYAYVGSNPSTWIDPAGLQQLTTNMTKGTTTFDPGYGAPFWMKPLTIQTRNAVDSRSKPGAADPYSTGDVTPRRHR